MNRKLTKPKSSSLHDIENNTNGESLLRGKLRPKGVPHRAGALRPKSRNNKTPFSLAKALLHKICLIPAGDNSETCQGFVRLLQDVIWGIILGTLGMAILLSLDYSNIINLETVLFRKTAFDIFTTPEILESIEEEIEKKLISMDVYFRMKRELSDSQTTIDNERKIVGTRTMKETYLKAQLDSLREEYDKLMKQTGLDAFCPTCKWGMGMNCQQRVNYMLENYSDSATTIKCVAKLVDEGKTKNSRCLN